MIRTIFICLICLLFAGCAETIQGWQINDITEQCKDKGGIDSLGTFWEPYGVCGNGKIVFPERPSN